MAVSKSRVGIAAMFVPFMIAPFISDTAPAWVKVIVTASMLPLLFWFAGVVAGLATVSLLALGSIAVDVVRARREDHEVHAPDDGIEILRASGIRVIDTDEDGAR